MTAQGKITVANLTNGTRVLTTITRTYGEGPLYPARLKTGATVATVTTVEFVQAKTGGRGRYTVTTDQGTMAGLSGSQTLWLAPADPAEVRAAARAAHLDQVAERAEADDLAEAAPFPGVGRIGELVTFPDVAPGAEAAGTFTRIALRVAALDGTTAPDGPTRAALAHLTAMLRAAGWRPDPGDRVILAPGWPTPDRVRFGQVFGRPSAASPCNRCHTAHPYYPVEAAGTSIIDVAECLIWPTVDTARAYLDRHAGNLDREIALDPAYLASGRWSAEATWSRQVSAALADPEAARRQWESIINDPRGERAAGRAAMAADDAGNRFPDRPWHRAAVAALVAEAERAAYTEAAERDQAAEAEAEHRAARAAEAAERDRLAARTVALADMTRPYLVGVLAATLARQGHPNGDATWRTTLDRAALASAILAAEFPDTYAGPNLDDLTDPATASAQCPGCHRWFRAPARHDPLRGHLAECPEAAEAAEADEFARALDDFEAALTGDPEAAERVSARVDQAEAERAERDPEADRRAERRAALDRMTRWDLARTLADILDRQGSRVVYGPGPGDMARHDLIPAILAAEFPDPAEVTERPTWPIGARVRIEGGPNRGETGTVIGCEPGPLGWATVTLDRDPRHAQAAVRVDLLDHAGPAEATPNPEAERNDPDPIADAAGYLPCGCHGSAPDHTCDLTAERAEFERDQAAEAEAAEVVHLARPGDTAAMCGAPVTEATRTPEPADVACPGCLATLDLATLDGEVADAMRTGHLDVAADVAAEVARLDPTPTRVRLAATLGHQARVRAIRAAMRRALVVGVTFDPEADTYPTRAVRQAADHATRTGHGPDRCQCAGSTPDGRVTIVRTGDVVDRVPAGALRVGWAHGKAGSGHGARWLTIPGTAHRSPNLADTPRGVTPDPTGTGSDVALVAEVEWSGVTLGCAYMILADLADLDRTVPGVDLDPLAAPLTADDLGDGRPYRNRPDDPAPAA